MRRSGNIFESDCYRGRRFGDYSGYQILTIALSVISLKSVTFTPNNGANFSVMATDVILKGEEGMGIPVCSFRIKPLLSPIATQFMKLEYDPTEYVH